MVRSDETIQELCVDDMTDGELAHVLDRLADDMVEPHEWVVVHERLFVRGKCGHFRLVPRGAI